MIQISVPVSIPYQKNPHSYTKIHSNRLPTCVRVTSYTVRHELEWDKETPPLETRNVHQAYSEGRIPGKRRESERPRMVFDKKLLQEIEDDLGTSLRAIERRIRIPKSTVNRIIRRYGYHPYHVRRVQALLPRDYAQRRPLGGRCPVTVTVRRRAAGAASTVGFEGLSRLCEVFGNVTGSVNSIYKETRIRRRGENPLCERTKWNRDQRPVNHYTDIPEPHLMAGQIENDQESTLLTHWGYSKVDIMVAKLIPPQFYKKAVESSSSKVSFFYPTTSRRCVLADFTAALNNPPTRK
ncbi:hypothetical protein EVAR_36654_1 [Eumeta japonica]|uniref:Uncharacterized protein n=1 Tax=Eumeta variegata TaxID=151549 RepID=A0A4C1XVD6_EUMVA|nr:hypothetical protein EVAR_36654_1 [Eumeta japonica]